MITSTYLGHIYIQSVTASALPRRRRNKGRAWVPVTIILVALAALAGAL